MNNIKQLLGLAKRAGKLQTGEQALISIQKKQTSLIFLANDASDNTKKKFRDKCLFYQVPLIETYSSQMLSEAVGLHNRMVIAVTDLGFSKKFLSIEERGGTNGEKN